jgi:hypothetical protein
VTIIIPSVDAMIQAAAFGTFLALLLVMIRQ